MDRPRIFISATTEELRTTRQKVAAIIHTLGYDTISQDDFPTGHGELRQWLRNRIELCEGLIQLVGHGYGAEPTEVDPDYGRVSYTQFEFLYASHQDKKTWIIVIGENCRRDKPIDKLDQPRETTHPDPVGHQTDRRKLQQDYIARLHAENHLRHYANSDAELDLIIHKLRDEFGELRQHWEKWLKNDRDYKIQTNRSLNELTEAARLTIDKIRVHLLQTAEETQRRELTKAEAATGWKERQNLYEAAKINHAARLSRIEDLAASFAEIEGRGSTTGVFQEMTRIVTEQGVDEAIVYVATQHSSILETVRARTAAACKQNRADLQALLLAAGMYETKGQFAEAYALYSEILGIEPDWTKPRNDLARFLIQQGMVIEPGPGKEKLKEAAEILRGTLALHPKEKSTQNWAGTQNNLGNALKEQGIRTGGAAGAQLLAQAVDSYCEALTVYARESFPQMWAMAQNNLGSALKEQGIRADGAAGAQLLAQAVVSFREALSVYTRESFPQNWAGTQNNLGNAFWEQGIRTTGAAGAQLLAQAVDSYREALTVYARESFPQMWAMTHDNLGTALLEQGIRTGGAAGVQTLTQAVEAYRKAITIRTRESLPQQWAMTQNNLGTALSEQGIRTGGAAGAQLLTQAVDSYREAMTIRTRESLPQDWAATQNNLGNTLKEQGIRTDGAAGALLLAQAVDSYREAMTIRTRESLPQDWAATQNNLGNTLKEQGIRADGAAGAQLFAQAVEAYRKAMTIRTRQSLPQQWAITQNNLGNTLKEQGIRTDGAAGAQLLAQAVEAYLEALTVYTRENLPQNWALTQDNLGTAFLEQGIRTWGTAGVQILAQAVYSYREALTIRTRESLPLQWAMTQNNLGKALKALGECEKSIDLLKEAKTSLQSSHSFYLEAGYTQYDGYFGDKLNEIDRFIAELSVEDPRQLK